MPGKTGQMKENSNPKLEEYKHKALDKKLKMFHAELITQDGLEYEPESFKSMLAALDRLKRT